MSIEWLRGDGQYWVPVVDGALLHSAEDPMGEARQFAEANWKRVRQAQSILVLGLGGGFHLKALLEKKDFNICVVEWERNLVEELHEKDSEIFTRVSVLAGVPVGRLDIQDEIKFIFGSRFAILEYPPSVKLQPFFYKSVIATLNQRKIGWIKSITSSNAKLRDFFESLDLPDATPLNLKELEQAIWRCHGMVHEESLIWMTLREMIL